jgi:hypothetical protein
MWASGSGLQCPRLDPKEITDCPAEMWWLIRYLATTNLVSADTCLCLVTSKHVTIRPLSTDLRLVEWNEFGNIMFLLRDRDSVSCPCFSLTLTYSCESEAEHLHAVVLRQHMHPPSRIMRCHLPAKVQFEYRYSSFDGYSGELFRFWRMVSSGLLRRVALVRTDVSEEPGASFIRVTNHRMSRLHFVYNSRSSLS